MKVDEENDIVRDVIAGPFERRSFDFNSFVRSPMQKDEVELNQLA